MNDLEEENRYQQREQAFRDSLDQLIGRILRSVRLQIVAPEINVVVLEFADATFCIQGQIGGELLDLVQASPSASPDPVIGLRHEIFEPAAHFLGHEVSQARAIGEAWNGHGLELSFAKLPTKTLIVQSIYAPLAPDGFDDCLRVAVVSYSYSAHSQPDA